MTKFSIKAALIAAAAFAPAAAAAADEIAYGAKLEIFSPIDPFHMAVDTCGATVLDADWILTAAHCVDHGEVQAITVTLNGADEVTRRVDLDAVFHEGPNGLLQNDVALLRLAQPLPAEAVAVALAQQDAEAPQVGDVLISAGWSIDQDGVQTDMTPVELRVKHVDEDGFITVVAADGSANGLCRGESGGPLMTGQVQVGIFSGVESTATVGVDGELAYCLTEGYEMYFTPVARHRDWIDSVRNACAQNEAACVNQPVLVAQAAATFKRRF